MEPVPAEAESPGAPAAEGQVGQGRNSDPGPAAQRAKDRRVSIYREARGDGGGAGPAHGLHARRVGAGATGEIRAVIRLIYCVILWTFFALIAAMAGFPALYLTRRIDVLWKLSLWAARTGSRL